jgi:hypothetical protein
MLEGSRVAAQPVASRVVLGSIELPLLEGNSQTEISPEPVSYLLSYCSNTS